MKATNFSLLKLILIILTVSAVAKSFWLIIKKCYDEYKILKKKLNSADSDESERLKEIDLLSYQVNELTESDVKQGEEQELESEKNSAYEL